MSKLPIVLGLFTTLLGLTIAGVGTVGMVCSQNSSQANNPDCQAEFAIAETHRQIRILDAKAEQEVAKMLAEAEVTRAEGIAKANKIIGDSLQGNDEFLRYFWLQSQMQVVDVPTGATCRLEKPAD